MNLGFVLKLSLSIVVTGLTLSADNIKISENLYIRFIIALPLEIRRPNCEGCWGLGGIVKFYGQPNNDDKAFGRVL